MYSYNHSSAATVSFVKPECDVGIKVPLQMVKLVATCKAIITRLVFGAHGFIAIWQVTNFKKNPFYWYLSAPILLLVFEGVFTLTIKDSQEWKWLVEPTLHVF